MMNRVTIEQAKTLKEIGYNEPVDMRYVAQDPALLRSIVVPESILRHHLEIAAEKNRNGIMIHDLFDRVNETEDEYAAPTLENVRDWLEETFGYEIDVKRQEDTEGTFEYYCKFKGNGSAAGFHLSTRSKALSRAIDSALYTAKRDLERKQL